MNARSKTENKKYRSLMAFTKQLLPQHLISITCMENHIKTHSLTHIQRIITKRIQIHFTLRTPIKVWDFKDKEARMVQVPRVATTNLEKASIIRKQSMTSTIKDHHPPNKHS